MTQFENARVLYNHVKDTFHRVPAFNTAFKWFFVSRIAASKREPRLLFIGFVSVADGMGEVRVFNLVLWYFRARQYHNWGEWGERDVYEACRYHKIAKIEDLRHFFAAPYLKIEKIEDLRYAGALPVS